MKRALLLGLMTILSLSIYAQANAIDKYFTAHLDNPAFEKFEVTQKTFELLAEIETDDAEEQRVLEALTKIEGIKVLANKNTAISAEYYTEAMDKLVPDADYEDLVILENDEANARFLIREDETGIQEFVGVIGEETNFVIAALYGEIDVASLSRIMEVLRNGKSEWLETMHNLHGEEIVVGKQPSKNTNTSPLTNVSINDLQLDIYPNPATDFINVAAKNGQTAEMEIGFYTLLGKEIQQIGTVNLPYKVELTDLPAGPYFLRLTDKSGTYKNFKIVKPSNK